MQDESGAIGAKLPLSDDELGVVSRLGRWMRIVGSIQLALAGLALVFLLLTAACGVALGGPRGMGMAMIPMVILFTIAGAFLLHSLRTQEAGEQLGNLANEHETDFLEFAFQRLKTVYVIEIVVGALMLVLELLG